MPQVCEIPGENYFKPKTNKLKVVSILLDYIIYGSQIVHNIEDPINVSHVYTVYRISTMSP